MWKMICVILLSGAALLWAGTIDLKEDQARTIQLPVLTKSDGTLCTSMTDLVDLTCHIYEQAYNSDTITDNTVTLSAAAGNNDLVHISNGTWSVEITAAQVADPGWWTFTLSDPNNVDFLPIFVNAEVLSANVYDSKYGADYLQVDAVQSGGATSPTVTEIKNAIWGADPNGSIFARLGDPNGADFAADIAELETRVDDLEGRLTAARAGYLDNLNNAALLAIQVTAENRVLMEANDVAGVTIANVTTTGTVTNGVTLGADAITSAKIADDAFLTEHFGATLWTKLAAVIDANTYVTNINNADLGSLDVQSGGGAAVAAGPTVWYVDAVNGNNANSGESAYAAEATIAAAVTEAVSGDTIKIAPGTYAEAVDLDAANKSLTLEGVGSNQAITVGSGNVGVTLESGCELKNLTITGAQAAVRADTKIFVTLNNCALNNTDTSGIPATYGILTLADCVMVRVTDTYLTGQYCGMYLSGNSGLTVDNTFIKINNDNAGWTGSGNIYGITDVGGTANNGSLKRATITLTESDSGGLNDVTNLYGIHVQDLINIKDCSLNIAASNDANSVGIAMTGATGKSISVSDTHIYTTSAYTNYDTVATNSGEIKTSDWGSDYSTTPAAGTFEWLLWDTNRKAAGRY